MAALAGLGAALVAVGVFLLGRESVKTEPIVETVGIGAVLVGLGATLLYVAIAR